jgi:hypothetical protein
MSHFINLQCNLGTDNTNCNSQIYLTTSGSSVSVCPLWIQSYEITLSPGIQKVEKRQASIQSELSNALLNDISNALSIDKGEIYIETYSWNTNKNLNVVFNLNSEKTNTSRIISSLKTHIFTNTRVNSGDKTLVVTSVREITNSIPSKSITQNKTLGSENSCQYDCIVGSSTGSVLFIVGVVVITLFIVFKKNKPKNNVHEPTNSNV